MIVNSNFIYGGRFVNRSQQRVRPIMPKRLQPISLATRLWAGPVMMQSVVHISDCRWSGRLPHRSRPMLTNVFSHWLIGWAIRLKPSPFPMSMRHYSTDRYVWPASTVLRRTIQQSPRSRVVGRLSEERTNRHLARYESVLTEGVWKKLSFSDRQFLSLLLDLDSHSTYPNLGLSNQQTCATVSRILHHDGRLTGALPRGVDNQLSKMMTFLRLIRNFVGIYEYEQSTMDDTTSVPIDPISIPLLGPAVVSKQLDLLDQLFKPLSDDELRAHLSTCQSTFQVNTPHPCISMTAESAQELRHIFKGKPLTELTRLFDEGIGYRPVDGPLARFYHDQASMIPTLTYQLDGLESIYMDIIDWLHHVGLSELSDRQRWILDAFITCLPNRLLDWSTECDRNPTSPPNYLLTKVDQITTYIPFFQSILSHVIPENDTVNQLFTDIQISGNIVLEDALSIDSDQVQLSYQSNSNHVTNEMTPIGKAYSICQSFNDYRLAILSALDQCHTSLNRVIANLLAPTLRYANWSQIRIGLEDRSAFRHAVESGDESDVRDTVHTFKLANQLGWIHSVIAADYQGQSCYQDMVQLSSWMGINQPIIPLDEEVVFESKTSRDVDSFLMSIAFPLANVTTYSDGKRVLDNIRINGGIAAMLAGSDAAIRAGRVSAMLYQHFFVLSCEQLLDRYRPIIHKGLLHESIPASTPPPIRKTIDHLKALFSSSAEACEFVDRYFYLRMEIGSGSSKDRQGAWRTSQLIANSFRTVPRLLETVQPARSVYITSSLLVRMASAALTKSLLKPDADRVDLRVLKHHGDNYYHSFLGFSENPELMKSLFKIVCANQISKVKTSPRKAGASFDESTDPMRWWASQRAIGRVGMMRMLLFMHNIWASIYSSKPLESMENLPPLLMFLLDSQGAVTTSARFPTLMQQQSRRLQETDFRIVLEQYCQLKQFNVAQAPTNGDVSAKFEVMSNLFSSALRLGYHVDFVETSLNQVRDGVGVSSDNRNQLERIASEFNFPRDQAISYADWLSQLNQYLLAVFDERMRELFAAYPR